MTWYNRSWYNRSWYNRSWYFVGPASGSFPNGVLDTPVLINGFINPRFLPGTRVIHYLFGAGTVISSDWAWGFVEFDIFPGRQTKVLYAYDDIVRDNLIEKILVSGDINVHVPPTPPIIVLPNPSGDFCRLLIDSDSAFILNDSGNFVEPETSINCITGSLGGSDKISNLVEDTAEAFDLVLGVLSGAAVAIEAWRLAGLGVYYIDGDDGSNDNDGTEGSPLATMAAVVGLLRDGDTLLLKCGTTYSEGLTITQDITIAYYGDPADGLPTVDGETVDWS